MTVSSYYLLLIKTDNTTTLDSQHNISKDPKTIIREG